MGHPPSISLSNLLQCITTLFAKILLISNLNQPSFSLKPLLWMIQLPLVLSTTRAPRAQGNSLPENMELHLNHLQSLIQVFVQSFCTHTAPSGMKTTCRGSSTKFPSYIVPKRQVRKIMHSKTRGF